MVTAGTATDPNASTQIIWGVVGVVVALAIAKWWRGIANFLHEMAKLWLQDPPGWGTEENPVGVAVAILWLVAAGWFFLGVLFIIGGIGDLR